MNILREIDYYASEKSNIDYIMSVECEKTILSEKDEEELLCNCPKIVEELLNVEEEKLYDEMYDIHMKSISTPKTKRRTLNVRTLHSNIKK